MAAMSSNNVDEFAPEAGSAVKPARGPSGAAAAVTSSADKPAVGDATQPDKGGKQKLEQNVGTELACRELARLSDHPVDVDVTGSSVEEQVFSDDDKVESSVGKPANSHDASAAADSSVVQPAANVGDEIVLAFYNITWNEKKLIGPNKGDHEKALKEDLDYAFGILRADGVFVSE